MTVPRLTSIFRTTAILTALGLALVLTGCIYVQQSPQGYSNNPPAPQPAYQPDASPPPPDTSDQDQYQPPPPDVVTVYDNDLSPYGTWVDVEGYGRCWSPSGRPDNWQPYTIGHWEYCDYGWTWVSEEDESQWGAVTYHYGRWYLSPSQGWVWIPGVTWAPAWVAWREGGGYCGWAPLPPQAGFGPQVNVAVIDQYVPPQRYVYCNEQYVNQSRVDQHIVQNNVTIVNQTTNITNITVINNHVVNQGMPVANVQRATGRTVEKVELSQATTPEQARSLAQAGKPVIYSPPAVEKAAKERTANPRTFSNTPKPPSPTNTGETTPQEPRQPNSPPPPKPENDNPPRPSNPPANQNKTPNANAEDKGKPEDKNKPDDKGKEDTRTNQKQDQSPEKDKSNKPTSRPSGK